MKNEKTKLVSLFIALLILFSISANAFTLFDDLTPSFGISSYDADDDIGHADETPHAMVPAPLFVCAPPPQPLLPEHEAEAVLPIEAVPFLNHISRAPPLFFS